METPISQNDRPYRACRDRGLTKDWDNSDISEILDDELTGDADKSLNKEGDDSSSIYDEDSSGYEEETDDNNSGWIVWDSEDDECDDEYVDNSGSEHSLDFDKYGCKYAGEDENEDKHEDEGEEDEEDKDEDEDVEDEGEEEEGEEDEHKHEDTNSKVINQIDKDSGE